MRGNIKFWVCCVLAAIVLLGCKGNNGKTANNGPTKFPHIQVPGYINDNQQAVNYLAANFWDKFFAAPSETLRTIDSISFEEAFGMYAQLLSMANAATAHKSVQELFKNLDSLALQGNRKHLLAVMSRAEHYFYDPNSPVLNEEIYLSALNGILSAQSLTDLDKMQYEYQHRICSLNRTGSQAADFAFRQLVSDNYLPDNNSIMFASAPPKGYADKSLYKDVKGEYTLLFFNNPDCGSCAEILQAIKQSPLATLVHQGKLSIVAMYIDEDLSAWSRNREKYPSEWIYAFDHKLVLRDNYIYGLRAIPSLYLLDKEKRVILKDAPVDKVISYFLR